MLILLGTLSLEVELPYDPSCPSVWSVIQLKFSKLAVSRNLHVSIGALVIIFIFILCAYSSFLIIQASSSRVRDKPFTGHSKIIVWFYVYESFLAIILKHYRFGNAFYGKVANTTDMILFKRRAFAEEPTKKVGLF